MPDYDSYSLEYSEESDRSDARTHTADTDDTDGRVRFEGSSTVEGVETALERL